jgi:hypothetical protein
MSMLPFTFSEKDAFMYVYSVFQCDAIPLGGLWGISSGLSSVHKRLNRTKHEAEGLIGSSEIVKARGLFSYMFKDRF